MVSSISIRFFESEINESSFELERDIANDIRGLRDSIHLSLNFIKLQNSDQIALNEIENM